MTKSVIPRQKRAASPQGQKGASLVEILVAILLLSVGLLAMVGLQASALKYGKISQFRTTASDVAAAYGELVRGNTSAAIAGNYVVNTAGINPVRPGQECNGTAVACTAQQLAATDLFQIRNAAARNLPGGDIFAQLNPAVAVAPSISLWVYWIGPTDATDATETAAWIRTEEACPAAVAALQPRRQCLFFTIPL